MDFQEWMNLQESNKVSSLILKLVLYPKQTLVIHDFCLFRMILYFFVESTIVE